jgi:hypothetical protein
VEQQELADHLGNATLKLIDSEEGHDGFLLEQSRIGPMIHQFLRTNADTSGLAAAQVGYAMNLSAHV